MKGKTGADEIFSQLATLLSKLGLLGEIWLALLVTGLWL
jgi:hypothetical protein